MTQLTAILGLSVALFLFWDGPLWSAPPEASHIARIAVSYLVIVPAAMVALAARGQLTVGRALTAVGVLWAVKLVITSSLYTVLARGSNDRYAPGRPWEAPAAATQPGAQSRPVAVRAPHELEWPLRDGRHTGAVIQVARGDRIAVFTGDDRLHTLRIVKGTHALVNVPVVRGAAPHLIDAPEPGEYQLGCEIHSREAARLVVSSVEP